VFRIVFCFLWKKTTLRRPARVLCEFGASCLRLLTQGLENVIASGLVPRSIPELPPWVRSAAASHPSRSASGSRLSSIAAIHILQTVDWSFRSMRSCPCAMPRSAFCMPGLLHSDACWLLCAAACTTSSPITSVRWPRSLYSCACAYTTRRTPLSSAGSI